jgi:Glyoxalase-like domain
VLDHLVLATPDLTGTVAEVTRRTGVAPVRGGSHPGRGTRTYLLGLGTGAYLEIIGADPAQPKPAEARPYRLDDLPEPRLSAWAFRVADIDAAVAAARAAGYDPGDPVERSRVRDDGVVVSARITISDRTDGPGLAPFLIQWADCPHPSGGLPAVLVSDLAAQCAAPEPVRRELAALGVALPLRSGTPAGLSAWLRGPAGRMPIGAPSGA